MSDGPRQTNELTGGAAIVRALRRNEVRTVFGIPGSHNLEIYRYLNGSGIEHVAVRHEQGGGYAADGQARSGGGPGVVITTTGPGLTNACTAAATAYADSVPMLLISPGMPRGMDRKDIGWLHEMKDQQAHLDAVVQRSVRVDSADEAANVIDEAFAGWRASRPRPVHLEVPLDVLDGAWSPSMDEGLVAAPRLPRVDARKVRAASDLLAAAERPVLVAGGGARGAVRELRSLAEALSAPVVTTVNGKGVLPEQHPLSLRSNIRLRVVQQFLNDADVLLVVGSEIADTDLWGGTLKPAGKVIRVDIDPLQLNKNLPADIAINADAADALAAMLAAGAGAGTGAASLWRQRAEDVLAEGEAEAMTYGAKYLEIQDVLAGALPDDTIVAGDSAQVSYSGTAQFWQMSGPGQFLYPVGFATLGYGLPAAIGAKLVDRSRTVLTLVGDGGFMFTVQELATAVELGISLPIVVVDNSGFAEIREEMEQRDIAPLGVDRQTPDLALLSRAFGGRGVNAATVDELPSLVERSLEHDLPTVISLKL